MRFWDSSALVPLLVDQQQSAELRGLPEEDIAVWWATEVECASALRGGRAAAPGVPGPAERQAGGVAQPRQAPRQSMARLERECPRGANFVALNQSLDRASRGWRQVSPSDEIKGLAVRLLRQHVLLAADAIQLAAALVASPSRVDLLSFVCLDERLRAAAAKEGFPLLPA